MDRSLPSIVVLTLLCLLVATASTGVATAGAAQGAGLVDGQFLVELEASGDAEVAVSVELNLTDDEQRATFQRLEDEEETRESAAESFRDEMQYVSDVGNEEVDREMHVGEVTLETETADGEVGVVTYRFRWESLAAVDDGRVVLAEPFSLYDELDRELVVVAPEGYELASVAPEPAEQNATTASWPGLTPLEGFEVVAEERGGDGADDGWAIADGAGPGPLLAAAALAVVALALAARRRR